MSLSSTEFTIAYNGDGAAAAFSYPYYFLAFADLYVSAVDADGTSPNIL